MTKAVLTGLDRLLTEKIDLISGKRVGLMTNHTGVDRDMNHVVQMLHENDKVDLKVLFAAEHGLYGAADPGEEIADSADPRTGLPIVSLYGPKKIPTPEMLKDLDVLIYDHQDAGARFYTFISSLYYLLEGAGQAKLPVIVLDRPNPIRGDIVSGNVLDAAFRSFVGIYPIPVRHGMTVGELAAFFNSEAAFGVELTILENMNWKRDQWWEETGLCWVPPSPNMPSITTAIFFPGLCFIEGLNVSEGRGTCNPFEIFGAPWMDSAKMVKRLREKKLPGVLFREHCFIPQFSKHKGVVCNGIQMHITDRAAFDPLPVGMHVLYEIQNMHPNELEYRKNVADGPHFIDLLAGTDKLRLNLQAGKSVDEIMSGWDDEVEEFKARSRAYYIY